MLISLQPTSYFLCGCVDTYRCWWYYLIRLRCWCQGQSRGHEKRVRKLSLGNRGCWMTLIGSWRCQRTDLRLSALRVYWLWTVVGECCSTLRCLPLPPLIPRRCKSFVFFYLPIVLYVLIRQWSYLVLFLMIHLEALNHLPTLPWALNFWVFIFAPIACFCFSCRSYST